MSNAEAYGQFVMRSLQGEGIWPEIQVPDFPHCDARVLHAPGLCTWCDLYPAWQAKRIEMGAAFTGDQPEGYTPLLKDPATMYRSLESIERWEGNVPETPERAAWRRAESDAAFKRFMAREFPEDATPA